MLVSCLTHDIQPDYHNKRRKVADVALSRLLSSVPKRAPQKGKKCLLTLSTIAFLPTSNFRTIGKGSNLNSFYKSLERNVINAVKSAFQSLWLSTWLSKKGGQDRRRAKQH